MAEHAPGSFRRLCAAVDIAAWTAQLTAPGREALQGRLYESLQAATAAAGLDFHDLQLQPSGDGAFIVFPADIDEPQVIDAFVRTLAADIREHNAGLPAGVRLRVRLSLGQGILRGRPLGYSTDVAIEVTRLVDADVTRRALADYPAAELAVIVTDDLFDDVIAHNFFQLAAQDFWPVHVRAKNLSTQAWLYVCDRAGGPAVPPGSDQGPAEAPRVCLAVDLVAGPGPIPDAQRQVGKERLTVAVAMFAWATELYYGLSWQRAERADGFTVVLPPDLDEPHDFHTLLHTLYDWLSGQADGAAPVRARVALVLGPVPVGKEALTAGPVDLAVDLAACAPVRDAADRHPAASLVVVFPDDLRDSILAPGQEILPADRCTRAALPVRGGTVDAWIGVVGEAAAPPEPDLPPTEPPAVAWPLPLFVPGWTAPPGATVATERLDPGVVDAAMDRWRAAVAVEVTAEEIKAAADGCADALAGSAELAAAGRYASAFALLDTPLGTAARHRALLVGTARIMVYAGLGAFADQVGELLDWVLAPGPGEPGDTMEPRMLRAESSFSVGAYVAAAEDFRHVVTGLSRAAAPPRPLAQLRLGDCLERMAHAGEARHLWDAVERLCRFTPDVYLRLGHLVLSRGRSAAAESQLVRGLDMIREHPGRAMATPPRPLEHALLIGCYLARQQLGDVIGARRYLTEAAELHPDDPFTIAEQAFDWIRQGDRVRSRERTVHAVDTAVRVPRGDLVLARLRSAGLLGEGAYRSALIAYQSQVPGPRHGSSRRG